MGLDIYFYRRKADYEKQEEFDAVKEKIAEIEKGTDEEWEKRKEEYNALRQRYDAINPRKEVGYFRKVNLLLPYFNYIDNCTYQEVTLEDVDDLLNKCETILKMAEEAKETLEGYCKADWKAYAEENLPTTSGFFFGGTEYDDYYLADVKEVAETFTTIHDTTDWEKDIVEMFCWW